MGLPFLLHSRSTMVRLVRLELTRLSTRASKTRMATNYITDAYLVADDGIEPPTEAYETSEIPFL